MTTDNALMEKLAKATPKKRTEICSLLGISEADMRAMMTAAGLAISPIRKKPKSTGTPSTGSTSSSSAAASMATAAATPVPGTGDDDEDADLNEEEDWEDEEDDADEESTATQPAATDISDAQQISLSKFVDDLVIQLEQSPLGSYPEQVEFDPQEGEAYSTNILCYCESLWHKVRFTAGKKLVPGTMPNFMTEIPEHLRSLLGTYEGTTPKKIDCEALDTESERVQRAVMNLLPILVRWLTTYRAPARFASWFLRSHGFSTTGVATHTVLLAYALLIGARNRLPA